MTFFVSPKHKLIVFNIMLAAIYFVMVFRRIKEFSILDLALLTLLPVATYVLLKKIHGE